MGGTAQRYDSQSTIGADSRYYGQGGGGRQDSSNSFRDDIPLRDHPGVPRKDTSNVDTDHVYDAGDPRAPTHLNNQQYSNDPYPPVDDGRSKRKSGMGFFKKKGRIPFVTYIFTLVQVIVFIVEIVKNGRASISAQRNPC